MKNYYWAITGRVHGDDEDSHFVTDVPVNHEQAITDFKEHLSAESGGVDLERIYVTSVFRSISPIEVV